MHFCKWIASLAGDIDYEVFLWLFKENVIEILKTGTAFTTNIVDRIMSYIGVFARWLAAEVDQWIQLLIRVATEVKTSLGRVMHQGRQLLDCTAIFQSLKRVTQEILSMRVHFVSKTNYIDKEVPGDEDKINEPNEPADLDNAPPDLTGFTNDSHITLLEQEFQDFVKTGTLDLRLKMPTGGMTLNRNPRPRFSRKTKDLSSIT